jgi:septum site-determining protein MinC
VAAGDIIIWGRLRGVAHAGSQGNGQATIAALQLEATQLRIASRAARVPPAAGDLMNPEIAYICDRGIRISPLRDYPRSRGPATVR